MNKRSKKTRDEVIEAFERDDLGDAMQQTGTAQVLRKPASRPTSILLDDELINLLKHKGRKRGLGYQTLLKMIVREHLHEY